MTTRDCPTLALTRPLRAAAWELRAAWAIGLRVSVTLERADVDRVEGHVFSVAATDATVTIGPTKNGRSRTVTVPPFARDAAADIPPSTSGLLFESRRGQMWRQPSHHYVWTVVRALAGRPAMQLYELRHCAATMLLERGMTPSDVAVQLGHQDGGRLVQTLYGHPSDVAARQRLLAAWDEASPSAELGEAVRGPAPSVVLFKSVPHLRGLIGGVA